MNYLSEQPKETTKLNILGCEINNKSLSQLDEDIERFIDQREGVKQIIGMNYDQMILYTRDESFRKIIDDCEIITIDGVSLSLIAKLFYGESMYRIPSIDIFNHLLEPSSTNNRRIFLLGAKDHILSKCIQNIETKYPHIQVVGSHHGYFSESDEKSIVHKINTANPDILFVGISSPKKEYFIARHRSQLQVPFSLGVGGAFDIVAEQTSRSPIWMRRYGIEWAWRLKEEPVRMSRRMLKAISYSIVLAHKVYIDSQKK